MDMFDEVSHDLASPGGGFGSHCIDDILGEVRVETGGLTCVTV